MDEILKEKIIKTIVDKKASIGEVADKLFITERHLKLLLENWGVVLPSKRRPKVQIPDRNTLMTLYHKHGTTQKVGDLLGVGINTVNKWMKVLKIPTRKMKLSPQDKVKFLESHIAELRDIRL